MKKILLGNEAVARGLYEAGCRFVSSYPGTPSTEITECAAQYEEIYAEWAPNEKVALESAIGASTAGGRAFCGMKHVGLNVAADPLFICSYTGVGGGLVVGVADDPGMHSSQNEQDSRHYAIAAKLPMLEPSDSAECLAFTREAYTLSERFGTPVLLRLNTRVSHSRSAAELQEREEHPLVPYQKDPARRVMMPAYARARHQAVEERLEALARYAEDCPFNSATYSADGALGIIAAGPSYLYAREVFGDSASYLKLGMVHPLPDRLLTEFASRCQRIIVIEELDGVIEAHCRALGIACDGKNLLPCTGEYSQELLRERLLGEKPAFIALEEALPGRPPVLCPGCPHRGVFHVLKKLKLRVSGDIGCYTLGAAAPLEAMDTSFCMGASISALHGFNKVLGPDSAKSSVAVIGDSTFMHSGMTGLVNVVYNKGISTLIVLDNSITAMTGHQQNPLTGYTLKGEEVRGILLENICRALGVEDAHIRVVDPLDIAGLEQVLREELNADAPSVIIARRPCALLKGVRHGTPLTVDAQKCRTCRACIRIGCPALSVSDGKARIDATICTGCGLCAHLCRFDALKSEG